MNAQTQMPAMTAIEKLQRVLVKTEQSMQQAVKCTQSKDHLLVGRALVAVGLCQQAKEQIRAACQNMGFTLDSLLSINEKASGSAADEQRRQLQNAKAAVAKLIVERTRVSQQAVMISMQQFAEESAIMAAIMVARADEHLKAAH